MVKHLLACFLLFLPYISSSQQISFEKDPLPAVLEKAKALNKPVFVLFMPPVQTVKPPPPQAVDIQESPSVAKFFNENFINYSISPANPDFAELTRKYFVGVFPTYLYLDSKGNPIYRSAGLALNTRSYTDDARKALNKLATGKTISWYQEEYSKGSLTSSFLKDYIAERQNMGMYDNHELIEAYVNLQTVGSFDSVQQVLFVLEAAPLAQSRALQLAFMNKKIIENIFTMQPLQRRRNINTRIVANTMREAIRLKNENLATGGAIFARGTFGNDTRRGSREFSARMVSYYKGIKDTTHFLERLELHMDRYYMNISADSLLKLKNMRADSLKAIGDRLQANVTGDTSETRRITLLPLPPLILEAAVLNNAAYDVYTIGTKDRKYLLKAREWVNRAIQSEANYHFYDTFAHILYRLQLYEEAEKAQSEAIALADAAKVNTAVLKNELRKMQGRTL